METFVSRYVREQKRYTKSDLRSLFSFSEDEVLNFLRRLKAFGVVKTVRNAPQQMDMSELVNEDIAITDDAFGSNSCLYVFTFVGVLIIGNRIIKSYPKYISHTTEPNAEMKQAIKVLQRYGSKEQIINMYNGDGQTNSFNLLAVMLFLLDDYHQNGLYQQTEDIVEQNGEGPILWEQTIDRGFAIISNNRPYYTDLYTHRSVEDETNFFYRLHKCVVSECSRQLKNSGMLDLFEMVEADITDEAVSDLGDHEYILYRLHSELNVQYNTHKQVLLKTLYAYIAHNRALSDRLGISLYGTVNFNLVWEEVCQQVFSNKLHIQLRNIPQLGGLANGYLPTDQLIDIIEKPIWHGWKENGACFTKEASDTLIPDIAVISDIGGTKVFSILDAKYYCIQLEENKLLRGQPGIGDITKQYLYQLAYQNFMIDHGIEAVRNCFLMPTDEDTIVKKGIVKMSMLEKLNLQSIQVRLLPAQKMYDKYLTRKTMDISELEL